MGHNIPPTYISPFVGIRRIAGSAGDWVDIGTAADAQVISMEQRPGAMHDKCLVRLPTKRLEYFDHSDTHWTISHFDECMVSMGGKVQAYGTIKNWIRRWNGNDEVVEFTVLNMDQFHDDVCHGQRWGRWDHGTHTNTLNTRATIPTAELIFNKGGNPTYNRCETNYGDVSSGYSRFWGTGYPNDTSAGWWNPITQIIYLDQNIWSYGGGWDYSTLTQIIGSVASTGGWSGAASGGNLTWQKPFPEMNVEGLTYGQAVEKILKAAGGFQYYMRCDQGDSIADMRIFRTYPPYTAHQTIKDFYLPSAGSSATPTAANLQRGMMNKDDSQKITHIIGYGDKRRYIGTIKLKPGWDTALTVPVLNDKDLIDRSQKGTFNPKYRDVMRRWILPRSAHDLNSLFGFSGETPYSREVHLASPKMNLKHTSGAADDDKPTHITPLLCYISHNDPKVFKIDATWAMLPDALGVYIGGTGKKLHKQTFIDADTHAGDGTLYDVYLTAAIESDARMVSSTKDSRIANNSVPNIERTVEYPGEFHHEARAPSMGSYSTGGNRRILIQVPGSNNIVASDLASYDSVNDQSGLDQRVKDEYNFRNTSQDSAQFVIPWVETTYEIGNVCGSITDRDISVGGVVVGRKWDFENQVTTLFVTDQRYR